MIEKYEFWYKRRPRQYMSDLNFFTDSYRANKRRIYFSSKSFGYDTADGFFNAAGVSKQEGKLNKKHNLIDYSD